MLQRFSRRHSEQMSQGHHHHQLLSRRVTALVLLVVIILSVSYNIYRTENHVQKWMEIVSLVDSSHEPVLLCENTSGHLLRREPPGDEENIMTITTVNIIPKLFHCGGYALNRNLNPTLKSLLPEYEWVDLRRISDWTTEEMLLGASHPWDIFVSNYQLDECQIPSFYQWLHLRFVGKILFWTPEDGTNYLQMVVKPDYYYPLGPGAPLTLTFLQTAFWAQIPDTEKEESFLGKISSKGDTMMMMIPPQRPRSLGTYFLIYAHSRCVPERESAFQQIATYQDGIFPPIFHGGPCNGGRRRKDDSNTNTTSKVQKYPNRIRLANWEENRNLYKDFRFCLTMEHVNTPGYITEKILVAFWAGCLPIYWGPEDEIKDMFNPESFIYWDVNNPEPALQRLKYLEENRTAYDEVMSQPILALGGLERYFSLDEPHGGGALKVKIRRYLGLHVYQFTDSGRTHRD